MAFGVFIHRSDSNYADVPAERYQFPSQYLARAKASIGDWIVYYEPKKIGHTRGYYAVAKIQTIIPDPATHGMYLAVIAPGSYLEFPRSVPFSTSDGLTERGLLNTEGRISGRAQSAVRPLSTEDFNRIIALGLETEETLLPRVGEAAALRVEEEPAPFEFEVERPRVAYLASRAVRDRIFRQAVLNAYDARCAITGLKLINGRGRAEVEAAHIRPVEFGGPDAVANGIALSGTAHWMFDRGLVSLADDLTVIISRHVNDQDSVRAIVNKSGKANAPDRAPLRPHPRFLDWHRTTCFKN